jgi:hypothetical protein
MEADEAARALEIDEVDAVGPERADEVREEPEQVEVGRSDVAER